MNRRALFGFLGVAPVAAVGAAMAASARADAPADNQVNLLTLTPSKPGKATAANGLYGSWPQPDTDRSLQIDVGADGNLWVRPHGQRWQRLVTA